MTRGLILTSPARLQSPGVLMIFASNSSKASSHVGFVAEERLVAIELGSAVTQRWGGEGICRESTAEC
jgi:hypothetical protein